MTWQDQLLNFIRDQGPLILALVIAYFRGEKVRAENATRLADLAQTQKDNHEKVMAQFAGLNDADVIETVTGPSEPKSEPGPAT